MDTLKNEAPAVADTTVGTKQGVEEVSRYISRPTPHLLQGVTSFAKVNDGRETIATIYSNGSLFIAVSADGSRFLGRFTSRKAAMRAISDAHLGGRHV
jgi:hypothetical protein